MDNALQTIDTEEKHVGVMCCRYFPANLSQSMIDGWNGSGASTVIACHVAYALLGTTLKVPPPSHPYLQTLPRSLFHPFALEMLRMMVQDLAGSCWVWMMLSTFCPIHV